MEEENNGELIKEISLASNCKLFLKCDWSVGIGGDLWTTGLSLCRHLELQKEFYLDFLRNKRIIELGSGTGLVGLYIGCLIPAKEIYLTDLSTHLPIISKNIKLNQANLKCAVKEAEFDWGGEVDLGNEFDVIIATDVVYAPELYSIFINALIKSSNPYTVILLGVTRTDTNVTFFNLLKQSGFAYYRVQDDKINVNNCEGTNFGLFCVFHQQTYL
mmetsp:Transcript_39558/g.52155  ORF Transcript_39558/g.52155 Transcript_39558/m.52155 type:complete len:216 (+) Transcript_39558:179-826(+)